MRSIMVSLFPRKNYDALIASAIGFFIIHLYTRYAGIGISPDSVVYMSVGRNLHTHGLLIDFNERPLVVFPAFYPIFLSAVTWITRADTMVFGPVLNGMLFAILSYTSGWIMEGFAIRSKWYKAIILSCITLSPCVLEVYSMIWSETLFLAEILFFLIALRHYFLTYSIKALLIVSAIAAVACVTRYAGIVLIGTGGILLLLDHKLLWPKKTGHLFLFGLIASSLLAINLVRNAIADGTATGMREESLTSLLNNMYYCGNILCDWLPIARDHFVLSVCVTLFFIFGMSFLFWRSLRTVLFYTYENIAIAFALLYSLFILISATFSRYELISSRLLSPLFIPLLWGSTSWILSHFQKAPLKKRRVLMILCGLVFVSFQINQVLADHENYDGIKDAGIPGYTEDPWQKDSEFVTYLRNNKNLFKPGFNVYSNSDDALYFFTGLRCDMIPHKVFKQEISDFYIENNCYLVWFNDTDNPELISLQDILSHKKMTLLYQCSNGAIYITAP